MRQKKHRAKDTQTFGKGIGESLTSKDEFLFSVFDK